MPHKPTMLAVQKGSSDIQAGVMTTDRSPNIIYRGRLFRQSSSSLSISRREPIQMTREPYETQDKSGDKKALLRIIQLLRRMRVSAIRAIVEAGDKLGACNCSDEFLFSTWNPARLVKVRERQRLAALVLVLRAARRRADARLLRVLRDAAPRR